MLSAIFLVLFLQAVRKHLLPEGVTEGTLLWRVKFT